MLSATGEIAEGLRTSCMDHADAAERVRSEEQVLCWNESSTIVYLLTKSAT